MWDLNPEYKGLTGACFHSDSDVRYVFWWFDGLVYSWSWNL